MAFINPSSDNEKRVVVNPKDLRFTQLDIALPFSNDQLPNIKEAISLIRGRQLDPAVFGDLTVHRDKQEQDVVWCEDNHRLYVLRMAGVPSVRVKFISNDFNSRRHKEADKIKLKDPDFMPRIRGEPSGVQFPPPSDNEKRVVVNPKELRFTQLDIAPSFTDPKLPNVKEAISRILRRQQDPALFGYLTVHKDKEGVVWCENNRRLYVLRKAGVESVSVKFVSNVFNSRRHKEADKIKLNDPDFMPRIRGETSGVQFPPQSTPGTSVDQEEKGTSLLGFLGAVAGYWGWKRGG